MSAHSKLALAEAVAATLRSVGELNAVAPEFNEPAMQDALMAVIDQVSLLHVRHSPEARDGIADDYADLLGNLRLLPALDTGGLESEDRERRLRGALGNLKFDIAQVRECAAKVGLRESDPARKLPDQTVLDRIGFEQQVKALLAHSRAARGIVDDRIAPEADAPDQPALQQVIIRDFVQEYHITDRSVRITLSIGDGIDLAVLERGISRLAAITSEMTATVKVWTGAGRERIGAGLTSLRQSVRKTAGSMAALLLKVLRRVMPEDAPPPPIPEDFRDQARAMILKRQAPPAHWAPQIEQLNFVNTKLGDLAPLAGLTALRWLGLGRSQVSDVSPLAGLTALQQLWLGRTQVSDVSPLAGLTALRWLELSGTQVSDVSVLAGLDELVIRCTDVKHARRLRASLPKNSRVMVVDRSQR